MKSNIFRAQILDYANTIQIAWFKHCDKTYCAERTIAKFREIDESGPVEPFLELNRDGAQSLIDALYEVGFRPTHAKPQDATISSIKYHLEDMRRLVFERKV